MNSQNTETTMVNFRTTRQSLFLDLYDVIAIADADKKWGLSGRVKSVSGSTITLRDPLTLPANTDLAFSVQAVSGIQALTVQSATATTTELTITPGVYPADAPDRAQFQITDDGSVLGLAKPFRVLSIDEDDNDPNLVVITALEINSQKYADSDAASASE